MSTLNRNRFMIFFLLLGECLLAQENDFHFRHLSVENGLSNNSVIAIEQDRLGQMWFGTRNGLNRYNGTNIDIFKYVPGDSTSLSNSDILSINEDSDGYIWVGTYNGLNRYDPVKNTFKSFYKRNGPDGLCNAVVICSKEIGNGEIWFGTANGISIFNKSKNNFTHILYKEGDANGLPGENIQRIFIDENKRIWIATTKGLARLESKNNDRFTFKQFKYNDGTENLFIQDINQIDSTTLGIATKYNGYMLFNTENEKFLLHNEQIIPLSADVRVVQSSNDGSVWLGTSHGVRVIGPEKKIWDLKSNNRAKNSLSQNFIKSAFKDKNGTIWLGTYSGGVNIWTESNENFVNFVNHDIDNNIVNSIVSDDSSNIYFGTEGGDITILNPKNKKLETLNLSDAEELRPNNIQTLYLSKKNVLWAGVLNYGILVYDVHSKKMLEDVISNELKDYLKNTGVYVIKEAKDQVYWIGTFGKGLVRYDLKTKTFRIYGKKSKTGPVLSSNVIKTLCIDSMGRIWAGGLGGLNLITFKDEEENQYEVSQFFRSTLYGNDIKTVIEDSKQQIYVGTKTEGLFKFNGLDFEQIPLNKENSVSSVFTIIENAKDEFWLSTDKGIVKYNASSKESVVYDQRYSLNSNEFSPNAGLRLNDEKIYFGGNEGVTFFNPKKLITNTYAPKIILSDLQIKNKSIPINDERKILTSTITYSDEITLNHQNSHFSINYSMPSYISPNNNSYAYRLVGLDDTWTFTKNTEAFYTLQKPGDYLFEVKGANNDGIWNESATQLKITIKPAQWKSNWAFALYGLLIATGSFCLYLIVKSRARLKQDLRWEQLENKRQEENHLAKLQFFTNISHDFRTPLTLILGPLQQILADYKGSSLMYKKLLVIESSANHLLQLINRLMDFRKLEDHQSKLQAAEGNIIKFLREIYLSFTEYAKDNEYTYTFESSHEEILVFYDRSKLEQVFYNLISNAFKYTPNGGKIGIYVYNNHENIFIDVKDTGIGIPPPYLQQVFDRFFEVPEEKNIGPNYTKGTGIGLAIAKNTVELHHGSIEALNNEGKGAIFKVSLPLGKEHLSEEEIIPDFKFSDDIAQYTSQLTHGDKELIFDDPIENLRPNNELPLILIVEDNDQLRSFFKNFLGKEYAIKEAKNGKEGLKKALKFNPDLVISDVMMPKMFGTELCVHLKQNIKTSHIPVILLTARTSLIYKFEGLESGADDYISKPFNIKEFKLRIRNLLESSRRLREKFSSETHLLASELTVTSLDEKLLEKAMTIVETNISNAEFNVATFCKELGVSRTMLFSKIKAWTNFTPKEFISEIRLKRAALYFEQSKMNISEVSYEVGFRNPKYFSKCFRKKYRKTPSEYIKKFS
ncbi:hybrid sensor histidine kinase/response regulator transcription factor [Zobellia russellii]|uniref:hybrid sensor histidine kinase/response regulator transcription factor n=1 Tax=Zobellia russellii TaxID=248907 RepID=UPI001FE29CC6|nr:two-component regulator propeller domain-containing protein [Zobellia russellii]